MSYRLEIVWTRECPNTNSLGFVVNGELKELLVGLINCNIE